MNTKPTHTAAGGRSCVLSFVIVTFMAVVLLPLIARADVNLQSWTAAPWSATSGATSFSGTVTDPTYNGGTSAPFSFSAPLTGVTNTDPANPDFSSATASYFGFESTGFGVGDPTTGRFNCGESFTLQSTHAFRLNQISWSEFTGDEVINIAWISGGVAHDTVFAVTANPTVFPSIDADANTPVFITNVSPTTANLAGRLRVTTINVSLEDAVATNGPPLSLQGWRSSPWDGANNVTSFAGSVTDGDGTPATFTFSSPLTGVDISVPATPNFTPATASYFGFESTGFGVGDLTTGRFNCGESFSFQSTHAFKLNQISWSEFTGDEVLNISWTSGGALYYVVYDVTANPSAFSDIIADANTPVVVTNVSPTTSNLAGRLRFTAINVSLTAAPPPAAPVDGSTLVMNGWTSYPFNGSVGCTSFTGSITAPENGGTAATMTLSAPLTGVNITDPANPDSTAATASYFGFESTGFGVGETNVGRFERGESFTLECIHQFRISQIFWAEFTGDEVVNIRWTQSGAVHQQVFDITSSQFPFTDLVADAHTPVVFTNVSPSTANLSGRLRISAIFASLVFPSDPTYGYAGPDGYTRMFGVNLAGGEGGTTPGTYGTNYIYPNANEFTYYNGKNLNLIRIPFRWERVQHTLYGALDTTEMSRLDTVVGYAAAHGMKVLLDMHNYDRYNGNLVGTTAVPNAAFTDVWQKLAAHFKDNTAIYAYGIMNEPNGTGGLWPASAQAGVDGIRASDTTHWVTVCGDSWASASSWPSSNPSLNVTDSAGKLIYEAHCYFAKSGNDQYQSYDSEGAYPDIGVVKVSPFIYWLKQHNARGLIGEYGVPGNDSRWNVVLDHFLAYLYANGVSGTDWAGGPWWGSSYSLSVEPTSNFTVDKPQMSILQNYY